MHDNTVQFNTLIPIFYSAGVAIEMNDPVPSLSAELVQRKKPIGSADPAL